VGLSTIQVAHVDTFTVKNCLMRPFLRGPRQITASSLFGSINPTDITISSPSQSGGRDVTAIGVQPLPDYGSYIVATYINRKEEGRTDASEQVKRNDFHFSSSNECSRELDNISFLHFFCHHLNCRSASRTWCTSAEVRPSM